MNIMKGSGHKNPNLDFVKKLENVSFISYISFICFVVQNMAIVLGTKYFSLPLYTNLVLVSPTPRKLRDHLLAHYDPYQVRYHANGHSLWQVLLVRSI